MVKIEYERLKVCVGHLRRGLEKPNDHATLSIAQFHLETLQDYLKTHEVEKSKTICAEIYAAGI